MSPHQPRGPAQESSTPAHHYYSVLQHQTRARRWLAATVGGVGAGLFANLILDWPHTLLTTIATTAGLLLWDHRHGILAGWWPADDGLNRLAAIAAKLERHGWVVPRIPATTPRQHPVHTHLFIGPGGVFVVEHQAWTAANTVTTSPTAGLLHIGARPASRRTATVRATTEVIDHALTHNLPSHQPAHPVIAVAGKTLHEPHVTAGVTLIPAADLARHLRRRDEMLTQSEITTLAHTARRQFTAP